MPIVISLAGGESSSQRDSDVPANKMGARTIDGKAIVIELSGSDDEDDDHEYEVDEAAGEEAAPVSHLNAEAAQDTPAPQAAASKKRKSGKTSRASSSLPSSRSLSEFRYTPEWLKNPGAPGEKKETAEKEEKSKAKKEKKRKAKKAKKDEAALESEDDLLQSAGERPPRRPLPYTQDTGYITSGPLPQFEDPDPTPASFWQDKAPGVMDWVKKVE